MTKFNPKFRFGKAAFFMALILGLTVAAWAETSSSIQASEPFSGLQNEVSTAGDTKIESGSSETVPFAKDSLMPDSPLSPVEISAPENPQEEEMKPPVIFTDLNFGQKLTLQGEIKVSDHEALIFQEDSISAKAYGNTVSLNLRDQKMFCVTFVGYVMGPFGPTHDYLEVYFDTLKTLETLIEKAATAEETKEGRDGDLVTSLIRAKDTIIEFTKRSKEYKVYWDGEIARENLKDAIRVFYDGEIPVHQKMSFSQREDEKLGPIWDVLLTLNQETSAGKVQNRLFSLKESEEEFHMLQIQDRDSQNQVLIEEVFEYTPTFDTRKHWLRSFYASGILKIEDETRYERGVKDSRYYTLFNETGTKIRSIGETFDADEQVRSTTDYKFLEGKKSFYKYDEDGRMISSSTDTIPIAASAVPSLG